jgi:hypothetical protein
MTLRSPPLTFPLSHLQAAELTTNLVGAQKKEPLFIERGMSLAPNTKSAGKHVLQAKDSCLSDPCAGPLDLRARHERFPRLRVASTFEVATKAWPDMQRQQVHANIII